MVNFSRKKKERRERYSPSDLKSKHIVVGAIFLLVIILTVIASVISALGKTTELKRGLV